MAAAKRVWEEARARLEVGQDMACPSIQRKERRR